MAPGATAATKIELVTDGRARASVLVASDGHTDELLAAEELITHIALATGVTLPRGDSGEVVIRIGKASGLSFSKNFHREGYRIVEKGNDLLIGGPLALGSLNAVYDLLRHAGIHWVQPGDVGVVAPKTANFKLVTGSSEPDFEYHQCNSLIADTQPKTYQQWGRRTKWPTEKYPDTQIGGHGIGQLPKSNRETEPELFVLENGNRTNQLDVTHPVVLERAIAWARQEMAENPNTRYLTVAPDDGLGFGTSEWDSGEWDPLIGLPVVTDRYIRFFNLVLEDLQKDWPEVGITFFAYVSYMLPPTIVKPNPRILPMIAPITIDRMHTINDDAGWERRYLLRLIEQWKATGVEFATYMYLFNLADPGTPFPAYRFVDEEFPVIHGYGGQVGLRTEMAPAFGQDGLTNVAQMEFAWDTSTDFGALRKQHMAREFGAAATAMDRYYRLVEQVYIEGDFTAGCSYDLHHMFTPDRWAAMESSLNAAASAAAGDDKVSRRVAAMRLQYDFGKAFIESLRAFAALDVPKAAKLIESAVSLGKAATTSEPHVIYPLRVQYLDWFFTGPMRGANQRWEKRLAVASDQWQAIVDTSGVGAADHPESPAWKGGTTPLATASRTWSAQGLRYLLPGTVWYRQSITLPAAARDKKVKLYFSKTDGAIDGMWVNGHPVTREGDDWDVTAHARSGKLLVVAQIRRQWLNEVGTGGIMGPVIVWVDGDAAAEQTYLSPTTEQTRPAHSVEWASSRRLLDKPGKMPAGTQLPAQWQVILDPSGEAVDTGLWEPRIGDEHWRSYRLDQTAPEQGYGFYDGGFVYRQRVAAGGGRELYVHQAFGEVQVWVNGVKAERSARKLQGAGARGKGEASLWTLPSGAKKGDTVVIAVAPPTGKKVVPGLVGLLGPVVLV